MTMSFGQNKEQENIFISPKDVPLQESRIEGEYGEENKLDINEINIKR